jgi:16S rRNA (cytosine1402-N4)-methyltransferase
MADSVYHTPVLVKEIMGYFAIQEKGTIIDGTVGGGGHAHAILSSSPGLQLVGLDKDEEALAEAAKTLAMFKNRVFLMHAGYETIPEIVHTLPITHLAGVLLDLGVSSHQIDDPGRGFSFSHDGPLDMRFCRANAVSADDVINTYSAERLTEIFKKYGEEKNSRRIARAIDTARRQKRINTTFELASIVDHVCHGDIKAKARIFQALRIEVNGELTALESTLGAVPALLAPGGRFAVISYHSLEDRLVKQTFNSFAGTVDRGWRRLPGEAERKNYLKKLTQKPVKPSDAETSANPRARSAHLRVVEKI